MTVNISADVCFLHSGFISLFASKLMGVAIRWLAIMRFYERKKNQTVGIFPLDFGALLLLLLYSFAIYCENATLLQWVKIC